MPWFKVDDRLHSHRKTMRAGAEAIGLWTLAGSWCMSDLTDGFVPSYVLPRLVGARGDELAEQLVRAGLWRESERDGETGYQFHNWTDFQYTREQIETKRSTDAERQARGRARRAESRKLSQRDTESTHEDVTRESDDMSRSDSLRPNPTQPNPTNTRSSDVDEPLPSMPSGSSRKRDVQIGSNDDEDWTAFWDAYPRKVGKGQARAAYRKARKSVDAQTILDGAQTYAKSVAGTEAQFVAHPATWLNGERWDDEQQTTSTSATSSAPHRPFQPPQPPLDMADNRPHEIPAWLREQQRRWRLAIDAGKTPKQGVELDENGDPA